MKSFIDKIRTINDFYNGCYNAYSGDWQKFPVLTRAFVQNKGSRLISSRSLDMGRRKSIIAHQSSGSTGKPVKIFWRSDELVTSNMALWRKRKKWYGVGALSKQVLFTLSASRVKNNNFFIEINPHSLSVNVSLIQDTAEWQKVLQVLKDWNPDWLYIQPSILIKLMNAYENSATPIPENLKYIECCGEMLPNFVRDAASQFFGVPVAGMYGSEEMNGIALQCPKCNKYHVLSDNVFVEVAARDEIKNEGTGEAIITNLCNTFMPLIRYNQNDIITLSKSSDCPNREGESIITKIEGRVLDVVKVEEGIEFNSFMLLEIIDRTNFYNKNCIKEFQFIYHAKSKRLNCNVVLNGADYALKDDIAERLKNNYIRYARPRLANLVEFETIFVDSIMRDKGKFKICKVEGD